MPDYQKLYTLLFNALTDALGDLQNMNVGSARDRLFQAQIQAEELYIASGGGEEMSEAHEAPGGCEGSGAACVQGA